MQNISKSRYKIELQQLYKPVKQRTEKWKKKKTMCKNNLWLCGVRKCFRDCEGEIKLFYVQSVDVV